MATRGSYVHNSMVKFKMLVLCNFLKILMVTETMIHTVLELVQLYL